MWEYYWWLLPLFIGTLLDWLDEDEEDSEPSVVQKKLDDFQPTCCHCGQPVSNHGSNSQPSTPC